MHSFEFFNKNKNNMTVFLLKREPLYHKLQYSKTPKFDASAAAFGVILGAFVVYFGLSCVGSMSIDLTDLTVFCWYLVIWGFILSLGFILFQAPTSTTVIFVEFFFFNTIFLFLFETIIALYTEASLLKKRL
jgi:hypothetical protein